MSALPCGLAALSSGIGWKNHSLEDRVSFAVRTGQAHNPLIFPHLHKTEWSSIQRLPTKVLFVIQFGNTSPGSPGAGETKNKYGSELWEFLILSPDFLQCICNIPWIQTVTAPESHITANPPAQERCSAYTPLCQASSWKVTETGRKNWVNGSCPWDSNTSCWKDLDLPCLLIPLCSVADESEQCGDLCWFPFNVKHRNIQGSSLDNFPCSFLTHKRQRWSTGDVSSWIGDRKESL